VPGRWRLLAVTEERQPEPLSLPAPELRVSDRFALRMARSFPGAVRAATRVTGRRG